MRKNGTAVRIWGFCFFVLGLLTISRTSFGREANPTPSNPDYEMYGVDSDDNSPLAPSYNFVDTSYGTWTRVTGFTAADGGYAFLPAVTPNLKMAWYIPNRGIPIGTNATTQSIQHVYVTTSGLIVLDSGNNQIYNSTTNSALPVNGVGFSLVAPLWAHCEFRTAGDSSKVFIRAVTDSIYITYYNLALSGTNGKVRATFQVVFTDLDTSVTINYRSFDGSLNGVSAAAIMQQYVSIGVQNNFGFLGTNYLDRGIYNAKNFSGAIYNKNLHNQLSVKFLRRQTNQIRLHAIVTPSAANFEYNTNSITPSASVDNLTGLKDTVSVHFMIFNLLTGSQVFDGTDTEYIDNLGTVTFTARSTFTPISCGYFQLVVYADVPAHLDADSPGDNYAARNFFYFQNQTSFPFIEDFTYNIHACAWATLGAQAARGDSVMIDPVAPRDAPGDALVLDRLDMFGNPYSPRATTSGDTITSAPINLTGTGNVYLSFVYQRGLKSDSAKAGIVTRVLAGPERTVYNASNTLVQPGDTLLIEGLDSTAAAINPASAGWDTIAAIDGGIDAGENVFRQLLPAKFIHGHFRLRFRMLGHNNGAAWYAPPVDDNDAWVVDGIQLGGSVLGHNDLEPIGINFGNGNYTHIPRNVGIIFPKVHVMNNGIGNTAAQNMLLAITDQLNRIVYWQKQTFYFDNARTDTLISMNGWNILGSQGGVFSAYASIQNNTVDYDHANDTNTFVRTMFIDDKYAIDDGAPDTAGSMLSAQNNFYYLFTPITTDSLRGADLYLMNSSGSSFNWTVVVQDWGTDTTTIATRGLSYSSTSPGWLRSTFVPVYLIGGHTYRIHFTQTGGSGILGGDASKAMQFYTVQDPTSSQYGSLYPSIDSMFQTSGQLGYPAAAASNIAGGGLLLPMVRMVYQGSQNALPVELVSFTGARSSDGGAILTWRTAKEDGVMTYTIERQTDAGWLAVAAKPALGVASGSFYDTKDASAPTGELVYRLSETELDGSTHELGTVTVAPVIGNGQVQLLAYPNPASHTVHVTMNGAPIDQLVVRDVLGRAQFSLRADEYGASQLDLDFSKLPSGVYYLQVQTGDQWLTKHITIQR